MSFQHTLAHRDSVGEGRGKAGASPQLLYVPLQVCLWSLQTPFCAHSSRKLTLITLLSHPHSSNASLLQIHRDLRSLSGDIYHIWPILYRCPCRRTKLLSAGQTWAQVLPLTISGHDILIYTLEFLFLYLEKFELALLP